MDRYPYVASRPYTPPEAPLPAFRALHARIGVERAVIVNATPYGRDNRVVLDAIAASAGRYRGVANVDEQMSDADLAALAKGGIDGLIASLVERNKEYVQAARITGVGSLSIMRRHILPNVLGPVLVLATIQVGQAILAEATLSFLGVGVPPTSPSLGTLIRVGNDFLFSGEWWITIFPGTMLVLIALSVNLLGDWLRDAVNPRLQ